MILTEEGPTFIAEDGTLLLLDVYVPPAFPWLNHVAMQAPRNGTSSHTVAPDGAGGTVVGGTAFTATAGRLLVLVVEGAVTSSTPSGWSLPSGGKALNLTELDLFTRSAAGGDTITTTHNGSDYPVMFHWFEFPSTATFLGAAAASNVSAAGGAGPSLAGLAGSNAVFASAGQVNGLAAGAPQTISWSAGTVVGADTIVRTTTDGYTYSTAYVANYTGATWSSAATSTHTGTNSGMERLVWAVNVP